MPTPAFDLLIEQLRASQRKSGATVAEMRAGWERMASAFPPSDHVRITPVMAGSVKAEWVDASSHKQDRIIFYLHGGGMNIGSIESYRGMMERLANASDARVLNISYRLAPEHPFPAALDDAVDAYKWLLNQKVAANRIVFAGDSAGAGLLLGCLVAIRDAGEVLPAAAVCMSPVTDLAKEGESMRTRAHLDPLVRQDTSMAHALRYVLSADNLKNPLASPLYADLHGLPSLLVLVGTDEVLYDDSTRFVQKAGDAGVEVTFEVWEKMLHIWPFFAPILPKGQEAIDRIGAYIKDRVP